MRLTKTLLFCAMLSPQLTLAAGAHQHGVARLDLVLEPPLLAISFHSPLANLIGFEHRPDSAQQQTAWVQLQQQLQQATPLIHLTPAADCSLSQVELHTPFTNSPRQDDHEHEHEHDNSYDETAHVDLTVEYQYLCAQPSKLKQLQLPLMQLYPGIEHLEAQLLTPSGQHLRSLTAGEQLLALP